MSAIVLSMQQDGISGPHHGLAGVCKSRQPRRTIGFTCPGLQSLPPISLSVARLETSLLHPRSTSANDCTCWDDRAEVDAQYHAYDGDGTGYMWTLALLDVNTRELIRGALCVLVPEN
jgi:hypothetical protein